MTAFLVTILLTPQWELVRTPVAKPMTSMEECERYARRQDYYAPPAGSIAAFYLCEWR